ncbi:hypothetical protein [Brucella thiophenivorans]|uniref:NERD domain-containing protein n=1 Tax=Brucella thiophenivorans TaxID=571255 RepID=A0A256FTR4_9HYPH|nr:hypothetical protein [Brucella thiophenivorans]OYR18272.1 hypothetical protein CEV31_4284 [Brucella thiophenivorans]
MKTIEDYLNVNGPCLSGELSEYLVKTYKIAPATARKRVSRAIDTNNTVIKKLHGVTFPHKARFIYLTKDFGSLRYWMELENALLKSNSVLGLAISALRARNGLIPLKHFKIACGAPLKQSRHLSPEIVIERLQAANLIEIKSINGLGDCVALIKRDNVYERIAAELQPRFIVESIVLKAVSDWMRKLGIASYDRVKTREDNILPTVGTFAWDMTAPSYLGPMLRFSKDGEGKNGFVACDILLDKKVDLFGILPFLHKCKTLRQLRNVGPCLQIFVADRYTKEAFQMAKKAGVIPATPSSLFGREVAEGLNELHKVLHNAAASIIDPEAFGTLFKKLGKIEGAAIQIRGTFFEFLAAEIARKSMPNTNVRLNLNFKNEQGSAEADVVVIQDNHNVVMIECKGYNPYAEIPSDYFKRWLQHNVPICYQAARSHSDWKNLPVRFEFWGTGELSAESLDLYERAKTTLNPARYTIDVKLGPEVLAQAKLTQDDSVIRSIEQHYMRARPSQKPSPL